VGDDFFFVIVFFVVFFLTCLCVFALFNLFLLVLFFANLLLCLSVRVGGVWCAMFCGCGVD